MAQALSGQTVGDLGRLVKPAETGGAILDPLVAAGGALVPGPSDDQAAPVSGGVCATAPPSGGQVCGEPPTRRTSTSGCSPPGAERVAFGGVLVLSVGYSARGLRPGRSLAGWTRTSSTAARKMRY